MDAGELATRALNRLCNWRTILTGRMLGTRLRGDPEAEGFRDLFDKLLTLRAEVSAITKVLIDRGVVSSDALCQAIAVEANHYAKTYEQVFPGMRVTEDGVHIYDAQLAAKTTAAWKP